MSNTQTIRNSRAINQERVRTFNLTGIIPALILALIALIAPSVKAQTTVTIANPITQIFGGAGVVGVYPGYTNAQVAFTLTGGSDQIDLRVNVVGNPAGVTAGLVPSALNPNAAANISALLSTTTSTNVFLSVSVANAPKGSYPLELIASNTVNSVMVTNASSLLVLPNVFIGSAVDTNWSTDANWSVGTKPVAGDSVRFQYTNSVATNASFDTSIVLDSLELMPKLTGLTVTNYFAPGVTVAVNGTNGFWAGVDNYIQGTGNNYLFNFALIGAGSALVVTNPEASFSMFSPVQQNVVGSVQNLSGLDRLQADVKRFGVGDGYLIYPKINQAQPAEMGVFSLAKTNFVRATYEGDYSGLGFMTNSIMFFNSAGNASGNGSALVNLGISNIFYADSMSGFSQQSGVDASTIRFNPAFTNGNAAVAVFRGPNGGRMSYFGVGVESGGSGFTGRTRATGFYLAGGTLDMLVDALVLSQNQTNRNGNFTRGDLNYQQGSVDAKTVRLGYRAPSAFLPAALTGVRATLTVGGNGSNAVMTVSDSMRFMEGTFTETAAGSTFARFNINNGGKVYVKSITWGTNTAGAPNNAGGSLISIGNGGQLTVTNTLCASDSPMPQLTVAASGQLNFHVTAGVTSAFVANLTDSAGAKINIASLNGFSPTVPATNVLLHYENASGAGAHPIAIGTIPAGFNNIIIVDTGLPDKNIEMRLATNAPAKLIWKGYVNEVWDHSTPNWYNPSNNSQVAFFDADSVVFAETNSPSFKTINVTDTVLPAGIYMSNSASAYAFEGAGSIGACPMTKEGTANFTNNISSGAAVQFKGGTLLGTGVLGAATVFTNSAMSYGGSVTAGLTVNGGGQANLLAGGIANGSVSVLGNGVFTNHGTIQGGSLSISSGGLLVNAVDGSLLNIGNSGSVNVNTNSTLVNLGNIGSDDGSHPNSLTVNGTFRDSGAGNIYLTTFTLGGTFLPGGDGIGTTEIKTATVGSSFPGRLTLLAGSTTLIKVDFANPQTNTVVKAQFTDFGGNTSVKAFDGGTVLFTNINIGAGTFAAGESFRVFTGPGTSDIGNEGLNTTNRYPIVLPTIPMANTKWDLANLRDTSPNGILNIVGFPTTGTNIVVSTFRDGGSVVTHLQWPSDYIGWRLQQQTNSLAVGLYTNWTTVTGSTATNDLYITNDAAIDSSFFRMVYP